MSNLTLFIGIRIILQKNVEHKLVFVARTSQFYFKSSIQLFLAEAQATYEGIVSAQQPHPQSSSSYFSRIAQASNMLSQP
jgi:hypothetical protein